MPEWLLNDDNYIPKKDKGTFIRKSLLAILSLIARFRLQTEYKASKFAASALVKFISLLLFIFFVSLAKSFSFIVIMDVGLLVAINFLSIDKIRYIIKISSVIGIFTFIILLPSIYMGYGNNTVVVTLKVLFSVTAANILASTTQWNELTGVLKIFRLPDIFIFVFDITLKYIMLLGELAVNMLYSLKLRSIGKSRDKVTALSGIIGTMFIMSKDMSEEMFGAMECRGFTGEYKAKSRFKLKGMDFIFILLDIIFILTYFYFDRL